MSDIADPEQPETGTAIPVPDPEVEAQLEQIEEGFETSGVLVAIVAGSREEMERLAPARRHLDGQGIRSESRELSAEDDSAEAREFFATARARGLKAIVAGAGSSPTLPGIAAAATDLPVIGVTVRGEGPAGPDALVAALETPPDVPVAWAIDGAENAGMLAARIINA